MDAVTIGAAVALAKSTILPPAEPADVGKVMVVGDDGSWAPGEVTGATITVTGTTLVITAGEG